MVAFEQVQQSPLSTAEQAGTLDDGDQHLLGVGARPAQRDQDVVAGDELLAGVETPTCFAQPGDDAAGCAAGLLGLVRALPWELIDHDASPPCRFSMAPRGCHGKGEHAVRAPGPRPAYP